MMRSPARPTVTAPTAASPLAAAIVSVARGELGVRETSRNQGAGIEKYWTATNYPDGYANREPWCAAFVCWCVRAALQLTGHYTRLPQSASVSGLLNWARAASRDRVLEWHDTAGGRVTPIAGDLVIFMPNFSHVGIVEKFTADAGGVHTIEGNTNDAGQREGVAVMRKIRPLTLCGSFVRFT
ncbi:MAG: CHAP domain-containing protein [Verrucomicrobiales bacterium]|jgi:hypothetical protein|nr:CHAP domain-containing protein [Verrucomicrobiales bacterium]